jgi:ATP adenylyltransferase
MHDPSDYKRHKQLWAPWRLGYLIAGPPKDQSPDDQLAWLEGAKRDCFLCRAAADPNRRQTLTVHRGEHSMVVLNRYPYNNGHLLIAPVHHKARLDELTDDEHLASSHLLTQLTQIFVKAIGCDGFNIGVNLGRVAGAGVPGHLHWHLVPRWHGDVNFMPILADASILPQSLDALYTMLEEALAQNSSPP